MRHVYLAAALLLIAPAAFAQDWESAQAEVTHVGGTVYMVATGMGGNLGVSVGEDGMLLIDDQYRPLSDKIRAAMAGIEGSGPLRFVLNTHWHGDHTGGNPVFGREATILSHTNVRKRLTTRQVQGERVTEPMEKDGWPVITFDESVAVHFNGETVDVRHFPAAHTDGDAVVFFRGSNVVHVGDILFSGTFPFVDHDSGGTVAGLAAALKALIDEIPDDAKIIVGHGPLSTREDLRKSLAMIEATSAMVAEQMAAGKSADDIVAGGLPGYEEWSWRFITTERWIRILVREHTE